LRSITKYNKNLQKIYECIETHLGINVKDVLIKYVDLIDFYKYIKSNYDLSLNSQENPELIKDMYYFFCKNIPGMYKRKEKSVIIKEEFINDYNLLLIELIHSKSITQIIMKSKIGLRKESLIILLKY